MKWGVRRYQNYDGSLTAAGRARQQKNSYKELKKTDHPDRYHKSGVMAEQDHTEKYNSVKDALRKYGETSEKYFLQKEYEDMSDEERKVADKKIAYLKDNYDKASKEVSDAYNDYKQKLDDLTIEMIGNKFVDKATEGNRKDWELTWDIRSGIADRMNKQIRGEKIGLDKSPKKYIEDWNEPLKLSKNFFNDHDQAETVFLEWANLYHPKMSVEEYDRESNRFFNNPDTYTYSPNSGPKHQQR